MNMPQEIVDWYLIRFQIFRNRAQIAKMLGVTRISVDRWASKEGLPLHTYWRNFHKAFHKMVDEFRLIPDFGEQLAETILFGEPRYSSHGHVEKASPRQVQRWLKTRLSTKRGIKFRVLLNEAQERGFTRSQLHYASNKLGVRKDHRGLGRGSFTVWSLDK